MQLLSLHKELSLHPKNAEELKGLILQFAVQGKLTGKWRETNTSVDNASVLLEKIVSYNEEQLKKKKRRIKKLSTDPDIVLDLPNNWIQTKNHVLFSLAKGKNPKDLSETVKKYPYQDIESLARGNVRRYSDDEKAFKCSVGDILVVCDGSRSGLVLDGKDGIVGSTLAIIETPPFIQSYIKLLFLQGYQKANATMKGAAIPHLDTQTLLSSDIGLPPLEEQKAIVEVVNALFEEVEALEDLTKERISLKEDFVTSALRRLIETDNTTQEWNYLQQHFSSLFTEKKNIKSLRETILQLAVQGKLTEVWRANNLNTEPASELLKRIQAEKQQLIADKKIKKEKPLSPIEDEDKPYEIPKGWVWCRVRDLLKIQNGYAFKSAEFSSAGIKLLRNLNIAHGEFKWKEIAMYPISKLEGLDRFKLEKDDIVISLDRPLISSGLKIAKIREVDLPLMLLQRVGRVIAKELDINVDYLYLWFNSGSFVSSIDPGRSNGIPHISSREVENLIFSLPPLIEQQAIVEKVNSLMTLCEELEQQIDNSQTQIEQLMQSCLKEVFD